MNYDRSVSFGIFSPPLQLLGFEPADFIRSQKRAEG